MPRERSRSPASKRRRTPIRGFGSDTRPRDIKRRRRSPAVVRSDQHSKPSVNKRQEVLTRSPNKGANSNRKPLERLGFIRFPGAVPRNPRPPVRRPPQPTKKTDVRRPSSSSNPKDARKSQSSSTRRKESSGASVSRNDQKPKAPYFRDDNRAGNRVFKTPGIPPQDHFPRTVSPPILRPLTEKERESYSDYRASAYKQDIDERQRLEEEPNFSNRGQRGLSPDRYRISSPRDPHLFTDNTMLRQGSPYQENLRDMDRDNYNSRPGKINVGDNYRHEGGRSFKFDDAAKITVDIRRKVREPSPGMHNMIDTGDIVIVRRVGEGCRPIFDREEIGVGLKHMDESGEYTERRVVAMLKSDRRSRSHSPERMGFPHSSLHENFEVQRDKFESTTITSDPNTNMVKPTLSDRWQQFEERPRKLEGDHLDGHQIDNRIDYQMMHITTDERYRRESFDRNQSSFPQDQRPFMELPGHQSPPRDRFQRYPEKEPGPSGRQDRFERIQRNPNDLRHNLSRKRHGSLDTDLRPFDARLRILERKDGHKDTERRTADTTSDSRRRGEGRRPSSSSRSRKVKEDRLPDFSSRPEKYKYQEWQDKPEMIPKGPGYFEVTKHKDDRPSRIHSSYTKEMLGHRGSGNMTCLTDLQMINLNR